MCTSETHTLKNNAGTIIYFIFKPHSTPVRLLDNARFDILRNHTHSLSLCKLAFEIKVHKSKY